MLHKRRIASSFAVGGVGELINKLTPFLIFSIAQQRLGVGGFGQAQLAISVFEVLIPWVLLASHQVGMIEAGRQLSEGQAKSHVMLPLTIGRSSFALLAIAGIFIFQRFHPPRDSYERMLPYLCPLLIPLANEAACVMIGTQKIRIFSVLQSLVRLLSLVAIVFWVRSSEDGILYALLALGSNTIINLMTLLWSHNKDTWRWSGWSYFWHIWRRSLLLGLPLMALALHERVDLFLAQSSLNEHLVGLYAAPMRLTQSIVNIISPIALIFFSEMLRQNDRQSLEQHSDLAIRTLVTCTLPLAFGGMLVSSSLLDFVFSSATVEGAPVLRILVWQPLFYSFITVYGLYICMLKDEIFKLSGAFVLGLAVTYFIFRSFAGEQTLTTIASASLVGKAVAALAAMGIASLHIRLISWQELRSPLVASAAMGLAIVSLNSEHLWANILLGIAVFGSVLGILEYKWLKAMMASLRRTRGGLHGS